MKTLMIFFDRRSSLRMSFVILLSALMSILQVEAQTFGAPYVVQSYSPSSFAGAEGTDVFFSDDYCANSINYKVGYRDNGGMSWQTYEGYVNNLQCPVSSPHIGGFSGTAEENSIRKVSVNGNGYISYMGYVDSYDQATPYVNTFVFNLLDVNYEPTTSVFDILTSPQGNYTYVCGNFTDTVNFGNNIGYSIAGGNGFLAKYSGGTALWAIPLTMTPDKLINLSNGTFVMIGHFTGTVTLNGFSITSSNGTSMFWAKFDTSGTCLGLTQISTGNCFAKSGKVNSNGELYLTGFHSNGAIIAGTTLTGTGNFMTRVDSMGLVLSAIHIGPNPILSYYDSDIDLNGNVYLITGSTTFTKYTSANVLVWNKSIGMYGGIYPPTLNGIGVDGLGNVGIAGRYDRLGGLSIDGIGYLLGQNDPLPELEGFFSLAVSPNAASATLYSTPSIICAGGAATITLNAGAGTSAYTWQQSTNGGSTWTNVAGTTNTTTSYATSTLFANIKFRVMYNSTSCGAQTTPDFMISVIPDPVLAVTTSNNNFCAGTSGTTLSANLTGGLGTTSYQWQQYIGTSWTNIAGATSASYTTAALSANTNYKVLASQTGSGCVATGINTANIIVKPLPNIYTNPDSATILNGNSVTLNAYNGTSYSWSPAVGLNTTTGATVIASPSTSTIYAVTGTGTNGCSKTIYLPITVSYSTDIEENSINHFSISPNPADRNIRISMNMPFSQPISFTISDILGKTLTQWEGKPENGIYENEISIENLSQGVYFLSVKIGERVMTQKFVKE